MSKHETRTVALKRTYGYGGKYYGPGAAVEVPVGLADSLGLDAVKAPAKGSASDEPQAYDKLTRDELEAEFKKRKLDLPTEGSGNDGNVVKADLVAALEADDANGSK